MIQILVDIIQFIYSTLPLLASIAIFTLLALLLAKSIKKYSKIYYIIAAIPFVLVAVPFVFQKLNVEFFNFSSIPVLGTILRDYIHMGTLGLPLLVIIMYMGALDMKHPQVKKLMSIRKELSIIVGFPVLTHSLVRLFSNFPNGLKYFTNHAQYLEVNRVTSDLGAGLSSFSFVLGVLMLALFLPLWITSFDAIHKRMGGKQWKKLQKWAYVLYATLFIHAMGIQLGYLLNPRERNTEKPKIEASVQEGPSKESKTAIIEVSGKNAANKSADVKAPTKEKRSKTKGIADINVSSTAKRYINIASLLLVFGSYLYLRLRKATKNSKKHSESTE